MKKVVGRLLRLIGLNPLLEKCHNESWRWQTGSLWVPPGHYYSPLFHRKNLAEEAAQLAKEVPRHLPHISLDENRLLANLCSMDLAGRPVGFPRQPDPLWRYHAENGSYPDNDAACLAGMARIFRPKRILEVGCGFSSALAFDLNDFEWNHSIDLCFVDPDPGRMLSLLREGDKKDLKLHRKRLQDTDPNLFQTLEAGDFLIIDSTHVAKTGSDVNYLFFEIFPRLAPGVLVHIHDIFWPFEYPVSWLEEGRSWNETYFLRAFLMHNKEWSIEMCNTWLMRFYPEALKESMPGISLEGASLWLCKTQ